ncbi:MULTISPECIES: LysR family transcriptional regulator [unclassified Ruegeria]|uniref:LysR family transcriptional regulator n=1 Tax=unclassified Ruegeria TaxID=2625375 RepID=UPI001488A820|nr:MULTISPECIES: LysR family transcriptional regulator [unclassified Ruegeria]NOD78472.1 LysR family transcriptional regulator [Ruegeria sp. HKCCD4332]NOD89068.1 LysR family transcriptional regulator [Ruegeria sp. HKCCD4318]NOE14346.1 LysR family transcriptional regulator [Ruegeria sp. HKCCD4318-2]NOG10132.1 LysR family transcriptional regulator [Ruegeria sp. HKCCD4315]
MSRLTLRQLEYLVAVGETGSIARAADRLNVSPPSISSAITQLEDELGILLFVRQHAQGLSLTQGGQRVSDQARQVLNGAREIANIAADISGVARGPLAVGCLLTFAQLVLPRLRRGFESGYPDVRVVQKELNQAEILHALQRSEIDIALTYDMDIPTDLNFIGLVRLTPFALLHAGHELAERASVSIADLAELPMVLLDLPISADYFLSLFSATVQQPRIVERTRDMAVMRSMVGNAFGYSIANVRPQSDISPDGSPLVCVPISGPVRSLRMGLLTTHGAEKSRTVQAFIDYARDQVRSGAFDAISGEALT